MFEAIPGNAPHLHAQDQRPTTPPMTQLPTPYGEISPTVLYSAKSGGSVERRSLEAIAAIFSQFLIAMDGAKIIANGTDP